MITNEDENAITLAARFHKLASSSREIVCHLPAYNMWHRCCESRASAYDVVAECLEEIITKRRLRMKFLLHRASDDTREEVVELTTLGQLLELVGAEGRHGTWDAAIVVSEIIIPYAEFPDIEWELMVHDNYLE